MYNVSVEQIIKVKPSPAASVYKTVMVIACVVALLTIPSTYAFGIFLFALLVVFTVLLFKYFNAEYEYSLTDGELTVDRIMARSMRKRCGTYNIAKAQLIAGAGSQEALRMEHKQLRTNDYTAGEGMDETVVIYTYNQANELERLFIQPDEKMSEALMQCAPKGAFKVEAKV